MTVKGPLLQLIVEYIMVGFWCSCVFSLMGNSAAMLRDFGKTMFKQLFTSKLKFSLFLKKGPKLYVNSFG
jgi:hypothetical protein